MENSNKEDPVFLALTSRLTRGKRMTKLLDDEVKEDELFWNQDALKEEEHDDNYEEEEEIADEFDSDFNDDESEPDEAEDNSAEERIHTKKRLIFPGKIASEKGKKNKKEVASKLANVCDEKTCSGGGNPLECQDASDGMESERVVRKSTRTSVIVRQAERDAMRAALQASTKPVKRKKDGEERRMTQEEMLLEAAQTEIKNLRNLERVLAKEEEVKRRATIQKAAYTGPQIRYCSKNGLSCIEFSNGATFQSEINTTSVPCPERSRCAITGLPAVYRDPKTGLPYSTKEAFKTIRDRFYQNNLDAKKAAMGILFGSVSGQGFLNKKKNQLLITINRLDIFLAFLKI